MQASNILISCEFQRHSSRDTASETQTEICRPSIAAAGRRRVRLWTAAAAVGGQGTTGDDPERVRGAGQAWRGPRMRASA